MALQLQELGLLVMEELDPCNPLPAPTMSKCSRLISFYFSFGSFNPKTNYHYKKKCLFRALSMVGKCQKVVKNMYF